METQNHFTFASGRRPCEITHKIKDLLVYFVNRTNALHTNNPTNSVTSDNGLTTSK